MSTRLKSMTLQTLRALHVRHFLAHTDLGTAYVCHVGDALGEMPFYNRTTDVTESLALATWCDDTNMPLIIDVGAHTGFLASQVAQRLSSRNPKIVCVEAVPTTFAKLLVTIRELRMEGTMLPLCAAVSS